MKLKLLLVMTLLSFLTSILSCGQPTPKEWHKAKPITARIDHPKALAIDENFIYFVLGNGTLAGKQEGNNNVVKIPLSGGEPIILFKGGEIIPDSDVIALDAEDVYFSAQGLRKVSKNGGESKALTNAGMISQMVLDSENIYWLPYVGEGMKPSPIYSISKKGGDVKVLTDPRPSANGLCADDNYIYWIQTDGIYKLAKKGGETEKVYTPPQNQNVTDLKLDAENFYFRKGSSYQELYSLPKKGGDPKKLANQVNQFWLGEDEIVLLKYFYSTQSVLFIINKNGENETEIDRDGYLSDLIVGKNKIFLSDVVKIYELAK